MKNKISKTRKRIGLMIAILLLSIPVILTGFYLYATYRVECQSDDQTISAIATDFCKSAHLDCSKGFEMLVIPSQHILMFYADVLPDLRNLYRYGLLSNQIFVFGDRFNAVNVLYPAAKAFEGEMWVDCKSKMVQNYDAQETPNVIYDALPLYKGRKLGMSSPAMNFKETWQDRAVDEDEALRIGREIVSVYLNTMDDMVFAGTEKTCPKGSEKDCNWKIRWKRMAMGYEYEYYSGIRKIKNKDQIGYEASGSFAKTEGIELIVSGKTGRLLSFEILYSGGKAEPYLVITEVEAKALSRNMIHKILCARKFLAERSCLSEDPNNAYDIKAAKLMVVRPSAIWGRNLPFKLNNHRLAWLIEYQVETKYGQKSIVVQVDAENGEYLGGVDEVYNREITIRGR